LPASLRATLDNANGFDAAAVALARADRILVTGNGASYYAGVAMWLASLGSRMDVVSVPSGLLRQVEFRPGDAVLAVSVSGEFRDLVETVDEGRLPRPLVLITASPSSTLGRRADTVAELTVTEHGTETHPQDFCTATAACLAVLARLTHDDELHRLVESVPARVAVTLDGIEPFFEDRLSAVARPQAAICSGHGAAWAGALELALLVKEIARIPTEGLETREGATSALTGLHPGCLAVGLESLGDQFLDEAERLWASSGAATLRIPFGAKVDPRVVPIVSFPAGAALAVVLAQRAGLDPNHPWWVDAYMSTARANA
jgi:fructoselysine-6-P-deglycase FrlB-like protein